MNLRSSKATQAGLNVRKIQKYIFKVLVMGDTGVGKTSLVIRSTEGRFPNPSLLKSTIGASFALKKINDSTNSIVLQLWDFAGQERFRDFMKNLFIGAVAGIFVFDITNPITLDDLSSFWIPAVEDAIKVNFADKPSVATNFVIVGNKADLSQQRAITYEEAVTFAEKYNMHYIEVSSKTGEGIDELFQNISRNIYASTQKIR